MTSFREGGTMKKPTGLLMVMALLENALVLPSERGGKTGIML